MIPLKDNLPTERLPLVTLLLAACGVAAHVALPHAGGVLRLLVALAFLGWYGPSVEDSTSRPRFLALCLLGGAAALLVQLALDGAGDALAPAFAAGAVAAVVAAYALLYRRARIVSAVVVPLLFSLVELPAWILLLAWPLAQAALGDWTLFAAQAAGLAAGGLAIRPLVLRRKHVPAPVAAPHAEAMP